MSTQIPSRRAGFRPMPVVLSAGVLVLALVVSLVSRPSSESPRPVVAPPSPGTLPRVRDAHDEATAARLLALERRVAELSSQPAPQAAPAPQVAPAVPQPPGVGPETPLDVKEQERLIHETFERQVATARSESIDASWADKTGRLLQDELRTLRGPEERYRVVTIDCRSHTCLAELDFQNPTEARSQIGRLVANTNLPGCGSTGYLDPAEDPSSHSKMRLLFDCDRALETR